jgi:hypothetical protein
LIPVLELELLFQQLRAAVLELRQLEGDGVDRVVVSARRREVDRLKSRVADLVSHDPGLAA